MRFATKLKYNIDFFSFPNRRKKITVVFFLLSFFFSSVFSICEGEERIYFSIHLASFKNLKNTNQFLNSLKNKGKVVFWKQVDVPGKGLYYRVYLGKYAVHSEAVAFWKKLRDEGAVSYFGVHPFRETFERAQPKKVKVSEPAQKEKELARVTSPAEPAASPAAASRTALAHTEPETAPPSAVAKATLPPPEPMTAQPAAEAAAPKPVEPAAKPSIAEPEASPAAISAKAASSPDVPAAASPPSGPAETALHSVVAEPVGKIETGEIVGQFIDNLDGTITDTETGLMWVKNGWRLDFFSAMTWWEAKNKIQEFRGGGYSDWRLPTIEEWQTLIDPTNQYPALVDPNPFENIIAHMPYWSKTDFMYAKAVTFYIESLQAHTVMLYSGNINHQKKSETAFVMPVRSSP
jgi:Protein of unknown function (DUF1566)/SPOR domain